MISFKQKQQAKNLSSIDINLLKIKGVRGIILDLDNTIISEDDKYCCPDGEVWIKQAQSAGMKFFILSNSKRQYRVEYWSCRLGIQAISPARKPFPFSFLKAQAAMELRSEEIVVIGDSLHTDIHGAWFVGFWSIQVASLPHPPTWWERVVGKIVQIPYLSSESLVQFDSSQYHTNGQII